MESWPEPRLPRLPGKGAPVRVYDTATRQLRPLAPGSVATMYVCGITPYDATHLGHAFTYLTFDLLGRLLRDAGHEVAYVQNVTDVDEPLFERAERDGVDWRDLGDREIQRFREDMTALRVLPPTAWVGAIEAVPVIGDLIERLRLRGAVYDVDGDLYFSVAASPGFGEVSHLGHDEMIRLSAENGGDPDRPGKKDPVDPLVWRAARPGEPSWPSPAGPGRPGWHVECAAIALEHLGPRIDVQGGGRDLVYPHHECSTAHAEVATADPPFARAFVHVAMVGFEGHKMSKSRGNLVFVSRWREPGEDPAALRLALLARSWRTDWEWTEDDLTAATARLARWRAAVALPAGPVAQPLLERVRSRLADDLDAPGAIDAVDRWVRDAERGGTDPAAPGLVRDTVDALLGIDLGSRG